MTDFDAIFEHALELMYLGEKGRERDAAKHEHWVCSAAWFVECFR